MCTTCGCQDGNLYIEGDEHNPHSAFRGAKRDRLRHRAAGA